MPEPPGGDQQDRSVPTGMQPRRKVLPLAPEPAQQPAKVAAAPETPGPAAMPRGQRIIIGIGFAYCAFIWLSMGLALFHRL